MSSFQALNSANAADVKDFISGVVKHTADGTYQLVSATNPISASTLSADSSMILSKMGLDETPDTLNAASVIAENIANGTIRSETISDFTDYDTNVSNGLADSRYGSIANAFNALYDTQATQLQEPGNTSIATNTSAIGTPQSTAQAQIKNSKEQSSNKTKYNISTITSADYYAKPLIDYQPKYRYAYIVQITMYGEYQSDIPVKCAFLIKKFDKPKTTIEYEEVNFYNFFSQVPKRTKFGNVSMTLHDDIKSESMNFIVSYLRRICPIFNQEHSMNFEEHGMAFNVANSSYGLHTTTDSLNIIQSIKVFDIFNGNRTMDVYTFNNPKITEVSFDDWEMESVEARTITVDFVYDNWYVDVGVKPEIPNNVLGISELIAGNPQILTAAGAAYDKKYTDLLSVAHNDPALADDAVKKAGQDKTTIEDGQEGDDTLTPDQLNTVAATPFEYQKEIDNLNVQKKDPISKPLDQSFNNIVGTPSTTPNAPPGLDNEQLMKSLTPEFSQLV